MKRCPFDTMTWFNEPENWNVDGGTLTMQVTGQSDYWRVSHYGFTVDDGPFLYTECGGEFEAKVKVSGAYKDRFDQAGLMLRIDHENWIKAVRRRDARYATIHRYAGRGDCRGRGISGDLILVDGAGKGYFVSDG